MWSIDTDLDIQQTNSVIVSAGIADYFSLKSELRKV